MRTIILLDIGNSNIDCLALHQGRDFFFTFPAVAREAGQDLLRYLTGIDPEFLGAAEAFVSSVNSKVLSSLLEAFHIWKFSRYTVLEKDQMQNYSREAGYEIPNTEVLAGDLFADLVGAGQGKPRDQIVVDLGTATKVLVLDRTRRFLGGVIYPGIYECSHILAASTDLLDREELSLPSELIHLDTKGAINSGASYGTALMVEGFKRECEKRYGFDDPQAILTGGGGALVFEALERLGYRGYCYDRLRLMRGISNTFGLAAELERTGLYAKK